MSIRCNITPPAGYIGVSEAWLGGGRDEDILCWLWGLTGVAKPGIMWQPNAATTHRPHWQTTQAAPQQTSGINTKLAKYSIQS